MITREIVVTDHMRSTFKEEGYFILENVISEKTLKDLREECQLGLCEADDKMNEAGTEVRGITHKGKRYFLTNRSKYAQCLRTFLFSPLMAEICGATLGSEAMLFHEQFVVKSARQGTKFGWHQDSGYVGYPHKPYLTCWCPLDNVNEENGTVFILPYSRAGTRDLVKHTMESESHDKVGYFGDDPGVPVVISAGSMAIFSSTVFHRSGANSSAHPRRVYVAQYAAERIMSEDGSRLRAHAEPILTGGRHINFGG